MAHSIRIGVNLHPSSVTSFPDDIEKMLCKFQKVGFEVVELPLHALQVVVGGRIMEKRANMIANILKNFNFEYSIHPPNRLNLMDISNLDIQKDVFKSMIDFANFIGSSIVVYHSGLIYLDDEKVDHSYVRKAMEIEVDELKKLADYAAKRNIKIAVENACSTTRTIADISNLKPGCIFDYGADLLNLKTQVEKVGRENVGITLDTGHAYISSRHLKFNLLEQVQEISDMVIHVHLHDNFGRVEKPENNHVNLLPFGFHDLHMPPGWGEIPFESILPYVTHAKMWILEVRPLYNAYYEAKEFVENMFERLKIEATRRF